jgi:hypothetical protein
MIFKIMTVSLSIYMLSSIIHAQEDVGDLIITGSHDSLLKVLVNPSDYENREVNLHEYISINEVNVWRLFLNQSSCKNFDNWDSAVIKIGKEQAIDFKERRKSSDLRIPKNCFVVSVSGIFKDYSTFSTQLHNAYTVGYLMQPKIHYPFSIE